MSKRERPLRQQEDSDSSSDDEKYEGIDLGAVEGAEEIEMSFEFFDPRPSDFHAVKILLKGTIGAAELDTSELADLITKQVCVGSMIKSDGAEEDPLGFITAINIGEHKEKTSMKQIKKFLLGNCLDDNDRDRLSQFLNRPKCGLLLQRKLINLPLTLNPELHTALYQDIEWARQHAVLESERKEYDMDMFIILTKAFITTTEVKKARKSKKKRRSNAAPAKEDQGTEVLFHDFENSYYLDNCQHFVVFPWKCADRATEDVADAFHCAIVVDRKTLQGAPQHMLPLLADTMMQT